MTCPKPPSRATASTQHTPSCSHPPGQGCRDAHCHGPTPCQNPPWAAQHPPRPDPAWHSANSSQPSSTANTSLRKCQEPFAKHVFILSMLRCNFSFPGQQDPEHGPRCPRRGGASGASTMTQPQRIFRYLSMTVLRRKRSKAAGAGQHQNKTACTRHPCQREQR